MLSICILLSTVFCSVALSLVTVYTIASYILSVHVRCINLYVYNIIFTAKKAPRKTAFYLFREANIFFICTKQEQKVCLNFSLLFISSNTLMTDFISAVASHPYLIQDTSFTVPLYTVPGYPPEQSSGDSLQYFRSSWHPLSSVQNTHP